MKVRACRQWLLALSAVLAASLPLHVGAATVSFDFTIGGSADSLTAAGNVFAFEAAGVSAEVRAFSRDSEGRIDKAVVMQGAADYRELGFRKVADGLEGLGICSAADGKFDRCLANAGKFSAGTASAAEWFLVLFDTPVNLQSFSVNVTTNAPGQIDYFLGNVDPGTLSVANYADYFGERLTFDHGKRAGAQTIELALLQPHNALLIGGDAGSTRFTLTEARATVVPLPAAWLLFVSALAGLTILRGRSRQALS